MTLTSAIKREKAKLTRKQKGANKMKTRKHKAKGTKGCGKGCFKSPLKLKVHAESCRRKLLKARRRLMAQITFKDIASQLDSPRLASAQYDAASRDVNCPAIVPSLHPFILLTCRSAVTSICHQLPGMGKRCDRPATEWAG